MVKMFDYLGYRLKQNNKEGEHIKKLKSTANGVIRQNVGFGRKKI